VCRIVSNEIALPEGRWIEIFRSRRPEWLEIRLDATARRVDGARSRTMRAVAASGWQGDALKVSR
jgi:hypothetical protein